MGNLTIINETAADATVISNTFIDNYMKDANDAQLTYNIYNASYDAFDGTVTMEKFLRSDVNRDGKVDTADGAAIIHKILNG